MVTAQGKGGIVGNAEDSGKSSAVNEQVGLETLVTDNAKDSWETEGNGKCAGVSETAGLRIWVIAGEDMEPHMQIEDCMPPVTS